jgi:hypothetical protein
MTPEWSPLRMISIVCLALSLVGCSADVFVSDDGGATGDASSDAPGISSDSSDAGFAGDADGSAMDVGNDFDGYSQSYRRVFITSGTYAANFGSTGPIALAQADSACGVAATSASLGGIWRAWLSTSTSDVASWSHPVGVPYVLVDTTTVVAADWAALTSGTLDNPINRDEHDALVPYNGTTPPYSGLTWTGTAGDGSALSGDTCADWTSIGSMAGVGLDTAVDSRWTNEVDVLCSNEFALYCVEQ